MVISISTILFLICTSAQFTFQFYLQNNDIADKHQSPSRVIENFRINYVNTDSNEEFPNTISIEFNSPTPTSANDAASNRKVVSFDKISRTSHDHPVRSSDIYTTDPITRKVVRYNLNNRKNEESELYIGKDGMSVATLIKNSLMNSSDDSDFFHKFRMIGTVYDDENNLFEIFPLNHGRVRRSTFDSNKNAHLLVKRNASNLNEFAKIPSNKDFDEIVYSKLDTYYKQQQQQKLQQDQLLESTQKRVLSALPKPIKLYVELLLVTDRTVFEDHKRFARTDETDLVFLHMRTYFSHFINGVNQRFQNSFADDPDLRIYIKLKNLFFLTTEFDSNWTNSQYVGLSTVRQHNGRSVIVTHETLDSFRDFMNSKELPFTFDHALGLFNKDLWTKSGSNVDERSSVVGFSYQSRICTDHKYAIAEEIGGFLYISIAAHEIGHNMGLDHDGDVDRITDECLPQDNYIMTPTIGSNTNNLTNQLRFSNCSIRQLKSLFLNKEMDNVSTLGECLANVPDESEFENVEDMIGLENPGLLWSPEDQCKMIHGENATFCHFMKNQMCTSLACRVSPDDPGCVYLSGNGAIAGTVCGTQHICSNGECIISDKVKRDECPFGDDVVVNLQVIKEPLPYNQMTCEDVFAFLTSINQFPINYCTVPSFRETCCNTCRRYQGMKCTDRHTKCPQYKSLCTTSALFNGEPLKKVCARTCGTCKREPIFCSNETCLNGGTCVNLSEYNDDDFIGYKCECAQGYSGFLCETKNPCEPNPCGVQEKCQRIGSLGHKCICDSEKTPNKCPIRKEFSVMLGASSANKLLSSLSISRSIFFFNLVLFFYFILENI